jgi:hypothetical protein
MGLALGSPIPGKLSFFPTQKTNLSSHVAHLLDIHGCVHCAIWRIPMDSEKQLVTIRRLRDAMEQSKALYEGAKDEFKLAAERSNHPGVNAPGESVIHSISAQTFTLHNYYTCALREYNRFVVHGKLQNDDK